RKSDYFESFSTDNSSFSKIIANIFRGLGSKGLGGHNEKAHLNNGVQYFGSWHIRLGNSYGNYLSGQPQRERSSSLTEALHSNLSFNKLGWFDSLFESSQCYCHTGKWIILDTIEFSAFEWIFMGFDHTLSTSVSEWANTFA